MSVSVCMCMRQMLFIFHFTVWTNEMMKQVVVYCVETTCNAAKQISATVNVTVFMFVLFSNTFPVRRFSLTNMVAGSVMIQSKITETIYHKRRGCAKYKRITI